MQLYVRYRRSKVERPAKQLRGFQRVTLAAGETRTVRLPLAAADLAYRDAKAPRWIVEPGTVEVMVGGSSADQASRLRRTLTVRR